MNRSRTISQSALRILAAPLVIALFLPAVAYAQTGTLFVEGDRVGIGVATPADRLHVSNGSLRIERSDGVTPNIRFSSLDAGQKWLFQLNSSSGVFAVRDETGGASPFRMKAGAPENGLAIEADGRLTTSTGAFLSSGGVWTNASSRSFKEEISPLSLEEAQAALTELDPVKFRYLGLEDRHVGFIAEDVPELVATAERQGLSPMDIVAVLTRVVQEQSELIADLSHQNAETLNRLNELETLVETEVGITEAD